MSENPILRAKDLANICNIDEKTARKYINDMIDYYKPKSNKITFSHYQDYFAIPVVEKSVKTG